MGISAKSLGIDKLPVESLELNDQMRSELDRRIADADANPGAGVPWELVEEQTRERLKK